MNKEEIQNLLDLTYELEGLLHLALARENDLPESLPTLIDNKISLLAGVAGLDSEGGVSTELDDDFSYADIEEREIAEMPEEVEDADNAEEQEEEAEAEAPVEPVQPVLMERKEEHACPAAFSLNDRFLFTRELFGGSRRDFDDALSRVAGMESIEEAEQYFFDELGFDPKDETVADFMNIVAGYLSR